MTIMPLGAIDRHFFLTQGVARAMGISLTQAIAEGRLTVEEYGRMVTRCRASDCSGNCEAWLACQKARAAEAPPDCVNSETLNRLR